MKKLILSALVFVSACISAIAQADSDYIIGNGTTTNNVAAAATNSYALDVVNAKGSNLGLLIGLTMNNATNSTVNLTFVPHDGTGLLSTVSAQAVVVPVLVVNTNARTYYVTNFAMGAVPAWRLTAIGNTNAGAYVTNIVVKAITKNGI